MQVSVTVDDRETQDMLKRAQVMLSDMRPLMRTLAQGQFRSAAENFRNQSFDGQAWAPLAQATAMRRVNTVEDLVGNYAMRSVRKTVGGTMQAYTTRTGKTRRRRVGGVTTERARTQAEVNEYGAKVRAERRAEGRGAGRKSVSISGRNRVRGGANILHPTGRHLLQQLHQSHTAEEARVAVATGWAWVHNFGAVIRNLIMPQRTFLAFSGADFIRIRRTVWEFLQRAVGSR